MENNKEENKKGFLDSIKSILPGAKKIKELEEQIAKEKADNEAKLLEAEEKVRLAEEKARLAEEKLKELEEQIAKEKAEAEANKSPEEKRKERTAQALSNISQRRNSSLAYNLEKTFHRTIGVATEFLDDPQIVADIIKQYPESITEIPTEIFATNYELFTKNFLEGISEICIDPKNRGYRVNYTAMTKDENDKDIQFDRESFIRNMLYITKSVFTNKLYSICTRAREIVESRKSLPENPYENIKPQDLQLEVYPNIQFEKDDSEVAKFAKQVNYKKNEANLAAQIISTEAERE